jgi:hypothetical protein
LKKISRIQKTDGVNYIVLRDKWKLGCPWFTGPSTIVKEGLDRKCSSIYWSHFFSLYSVNLCPCQTGVLESFACVCHQPSELFMMWNIIEVAWDCCLGSLHMSTDMVITLTNSSTMCRIICHSCLRI